MKFFSLTTFFSILVIFLTRHISFAQGIAEHNPRMNSTSKPFGTTIFFSKHLINEYQPKNTLRVRVVDNLNNSIFHTKVLIWLEGEREYDIREKKTTRDGSVEFEVKPYKEYGVQAERITTEHDIRKSTNLKINDEDTSEVKIQFNNPSVQDGTTVGFILSLYDQNENEIKDSMNLLLRIKGSKERSVQAKSGNIKIVSGVDEGEYVIDAIHSYGNNKFYNVQKKEYLKLKRDIYTCNMQRMNLKPGYHFLADLIFDHPEDLSVGDVERRGGVSSTISFGIIPVPAVAASPISFKSFGLGFETGFILQRTAIRSFLLLDLEDLDEKNENDIQLILFNVGPSYHFFHLYKFHFFVSGGIGYEYFKRLNWKQESLSTSLSVGIQFRYLHLLGGTQELYIQFTRFFTGQLDAAILPGINGTIRIPIPIPN